MSHSRLEISPVHRDNVERSRLAVALLKHIEKARRIRPDGAEPDEQMEYLRH